jgi:hypothetical protein
VDAPVRRTRVVDHALLALAQDVGQFCALNVFDSPFASTLEHRDAYIQYLLRRLQPPHAFVEEAIRAYSLV